MSREAHSRDRRNAARFENHVLNKRERDWREDTTRKRAHKPTLWPVRVIDLETGPKKEIMPTSNCFAVKTTRKPARKELVK